MVILKIREVIKNLLSGFWQDLKELLKMELA
jgi:hypothetical protein